MPGGDDRTWGNQGMDGAGRRKGEADELTMFIAVIRILYMATNSVNVSIWPGAGFT